MFVLGLLSIAIPTITFKIGDEYKRIRGIDPKDFSKDFVISDFAFRPSLDLQGGKIATFKIIIPIEGAEKRKEELEKTKNIIFSRLINSRISNFELNSLVNTEKDEYKIILKFPNNLSENLMQVITTPGNISFYTDDSQNQKTDTTDPNATKDKPFGDRIITKLSNSDIESVKVVSDARCYFNDINAPRNYCLAIQFKASSDTLFKNALYSNPTPKLPLLMVIDESPIAVQTGGQIFNPTRPGRELLVYPVVDDNWLATSILGSLMNTTPLTTYIEKEQINDLQPLLQEDIINVVKISLLVGFVICDVLLIIYFRKKALFAIVVSTIFLITNIAVLKIFNLILDLPLIFGFILAYALFMAFVIGLLYRIRTASKSGLIEEELFISKEAIKFEYRNITLVVVLISFVMNIFGTIFSVSLFTGFTFGLLLGLVIVYNAFSIVLPIIFLKSKKWQIW